MGICCLSGLTILFYFFVKNHLTTSMPRRHSRRRQTHGSLMSFGPRKWNTLFWKLCTVRKFFVCRSVYVYIQSPPLLSVRTVNNTQGISVQGAQTSSPPPPSPKHVKQCTLYSRDDCRGRRIYMRGFYTVCVAFQCGLLPKKVLLFTLLILFRIVYSYIALFIVNPNCTGIFSYRVKLFRIVYAYINCLD